MKNKILFLLIFSLFLAFSQGCKKDESKNSTETIYVSINSNQTYQYNLGSFGDEEGASISKQASHFQISKLERINFVDVVYTYKPLQDHTGTDEVEIRVERGSDGASPNADIINYIFKIIITN